MGKEIKAGTAPELNEQELRALAEKQAVTIQEKDGSINDLTATIQEKDGKIKELTASIEEIDGIVKAQEETISDLMEKLSQSEERRKTGIVTLKHNKVTYKVIGVKVPTLGMSKDIGANSIPAEELHKHPKLVEQFLQKGIGFLVPIGE